MIRFQCPCSAADCHTSLQGILRTKEVVERLKAIPPTPGQKPPILVYLGVLLQKGKLNALESAELARCVGVTNTCLFLIAMLTAQHAFTCCC